MVVKFGQNSPFHTSGHWFVENIPLLFQNILFVIVKEIFIINVFIILAKTQNPTNILNIASQEIKRQFNIYELTIQVEEYRDEMSDCQQCQTPES